MEYWRRCSTPSTIRRRVSDWPGVNANSSARSSGTSKVTATASSVSSSTSATFSAWKAVALLTDHQISFTCSNGSRQFEQR